MLPAAVFGGQGAADGAIEGPAAVPGPLSLNPQARLCASAQATRGHAAAGNTRLKIRFHESLRSYLNAVEDEATRVRAATLGSLLLVLFSLTDGNCRSCFVRLFHLASS
jgi:hypothetical protein